jgi:ABC-type molybdenum transport system ATPase subunit/photorepair protein PhrA
MHDILLDPQLLRIDEICDELDLINGRHFIEYIQLLLVEQELRQWIYYLDEIMEVKTSLYEMLFTL